MRLLQQELDSYHKRQGELIGNLFSILSTVVERRWTGHRPVSMLSRHLEQTERKKQGTWAKPLSPI